MDTTFFTREGLVSLLDVWHWRNALPATRADWLSATTAPRHGCPEAQHGEASLLRQ